MDHGEERVSHRPDPVAPMNSVCETDLGAADRESFPSGGGAMAVPIPPATGERIVPGKVAENLFRQHEVRYQFAGSYVKEKDVVDVACGTGIGTEYLRQAGAHRCLGLDIDLATIEYAKGTYGECHFVRCDALSLPLANASVDVIVSFETLEHLGDPLRFVSECKRICRPGGMFICSTPNHRLYRWYGHNPFHYHEFLPREFTDMVEILFGEVEVFGQADRTYPFFLTKGLFVRAVTRLGLQAPVRKLLRHPMPPQSARTHFELPGNGAPPELRPYVDQWWIQPIYLIALCRKPR